MQRAKCDRRGEMWIRKRGCNIYWHIHLACLFSTCCMSDTVSGFGNTEKRPSSSGFPFTEDMLLILYGVFVVTAWGLRLSRYCEYPLSPLANLSLQSNLVHTSIIAVNTAWGSRMRMWITILLPLRSIQETLGITYHTLGTVLQTECVCVCVKSLWVCMLSGPSKLFSLSPGFLIFTMKIIIKIPTFFMRIKSPVRCT